MVFEDKSRNRWKKVLSFLTLFLLVCSILTTLVVASFMITPDLPLIKALANTHGKAINLPSTLKKGIVYTENTNKNLLSPILPDYSTSSGDIKLPLLLPDRKYIRSAFVVQDDPKCISDIKRHIDDLDIVFPNWFFITKNACDVTEAIDPNFEKLLSSSKKMIFPTVSNIGEDEKWKIEEFSALLHNPDENEWIPPLLVHFLKKYHSQGINFDIEGIKPEDKSLFLDWFKKAVTLLHDNKLYVAICVPMNDPYYDIQEIAKVADLVIIMGYDEHFLGGTPGPIASQDWFEKNMEKNLEKIPPEKILMGIGSYSYDWNLENPNLSRSCDFNEIIDIADNVDASVTLDSKSLNSYFSYIDPQKNKHEVWLLDAVSVWNELYVLKDSHIRGLSLWRMGIEDPSIWKIIKIVNQSKLTDPKILETIDEITNVSIEGEGEFITVVSEPQIGKRMIEADGSFIVYSEYTILPTSYVVERFGRKESKYISITFDDGPSPVYTPAILKILKEENVPATFFVVGDQAQKNQQIIRQEFLDGHLIGNHTYTHPDISKISIEQLETELNATQRTIESITDHQTLLFRTPYNTDTSPEQAYDICPLYKVCKLGYLVVGADIDSQDWKRPGVDKIVQTVLTSLNETESNIIVMHDAGGDRQQTVGALKKLIPILKDKGYQFVSLDYLLDQKQSLMPVLSRQESFLSIGETVYIWLRNTGWRVLSFFFYGATLICILRLLLLGFFIFLSRNKSRNDVKPDLMKHLPKATVIIPVFNEELIINKTINAILQNTVLPEQILVIDDGSTDQTAQIVESMAQKNCLIKLIHKENGGKASALNVGFRIAKSEIVITIDGDTIFLPYTIENLIKPFMDPTLDAVCGNVQVGNISNLLTSFQNLEYITSQNYDRRAFDALNCISVVPGATGAWKRTKVLEVGGYSSDTLTEDADITLTLLEHGAKIVYSPEARSLTEAPSSMQSLMKQRFRWSYGTMQCIWKHRSSFGKGTLGWIAFPNIFLFQVLFPILSPIGDMLFLFALLMGHITPFLIGGYLLFLCMDVIGSIIALRLEKKSYKSLWLIIIQRFTYVQLMRWVTFKSILSVLKGTCHSWNKLERTNTVKFDAL